MFSCLCILVSLVGFYGIRVKDTFTSCAAAFTINGQRIPLHFKSSGSEQNGLINH